MPTKTQVDLLTFICASFLTIFGMTQPAVAWQANVIQGEVQPVAAPAKQPYGFKVEKSCQVNGVIEQGKTGTCWSFATASFIESELMRMGKGNHRLSAMHIVKNIYRDKAQNYLLRQGKANFSQGALAHDFLNAADRYGLVPEEVFNGLKSGSTSHNHAEMEAVLTGVLESLVKLKKLSPNWEPVVSGILDVYLGTSPERFNYGGKSFDAKSLAAELGYRRDNYVSLTSYTHHPFGKPFVLEIPDNFSSGSFQNVPIDQLMSTIDNAIGNGYSVAWDGDISEKTFSSTKGLAVLPVNAQRKDVFEFLGPEKSVSQADRQATFNSFSTTDDHMMHLVGISRDAAGNKYYVIKNSWGEIGPYNGYLHMSEAYVRLKTIAIVVHKDVVVRQR
jgi:bleomycin hydrolase